MENQEVTFHCTATGNPTPDITWVKDGETVALGEILNFKANRSDSGKYLCSASNGLNRTANTSAYLDVQCENKNTVLTDRNKAISTSLQISDT